jgi:phosphoserine phosphatase
VVVPLVIFDMDGTLLACETLEVIAKEIGVVKEVKEITDAAMNGKLDFEEAVKMRLNLLRGIGVEKIVEIAHELPLMQGAQRTINVLKKKGFKIGIITGGFELVAEVIADKLGVDFFVANKLEVVGGVLTGEFKLNVNGNKDLLLRNAALHWGAKITVAVGDGANDIPMLKEADLGIGFNGKPVVVAAANKNIQNDLRNILPIIDPIVQKFLNKVK